MTEVRITAMTEDDVTAVLAIERASFGEADAEGALAVRETQFREELARAWARLRVARAGDRIDGYVLFWHVADEIHLLNVAVDRAARRNGIGRRLVETVIVYAREHAAAKVLLEVRASNAAAIGLYEGLSFERFNVRKAYYPDGEDGIEMVLLITPV